MRVYLGGPINGCTDDEAHGWRERVKEVLAAAGHAWSDPMDRDYRGRESSPGIAELIVDGDKADIERCDVLLMNAPKPSWGTAMEIFFGHSISRPVIVVLPEGTTPSPWLQFHATAIRYGAITSAARELCA